MNVHSIRLFVSFCLLLAGLMGMALAKDSGPPKPDAAKTVEESKPSKVKSARTKQENKAKTPDEGATKTSDASESAAADGVYEAPKPKPLPKLSKEDGRGESVVIIPIKGTIDLGLAPFVKRALESAPKAAAVIFDVDTFGGRVDAAVQIRDAILSTSVPTIAYVNRRAISAGALISLAADYIVFAPGSSMGAATPIQVEGGKAKAVGEKMVSYMRGEMRATAEAKGRDGRVAEAMVDAEVELAGVSKKGKLLTMTTKQAEKWGILSATSATLRDLLDSVGLDRATVKKQEANWAENIARFLTDPVVSGLLMSLGMLGLLLELYTPGFGIAGGLGLSCLMLFFGGHMVTNLAGWEELSIFMLGLVALGIEVFVIPGFGIAGVIGLGLIGVGLAMAMVGLPISTSWDAGLLQAAMTTVVVSLFATSVLGVFVIRYLPDTRVGRWLVLETTLGGTASGELPDSNEAWELSSQDKRQYLDARGHALTDLRPSGKAQVGEDVLDVVSRDTWIPRHTAIKVVHVEGIRIVVIEDKGTV
jgi:membrane-bound serine protease (ClpP class)